MLPHRTRLPSRTTSYILPLVNLVSSVIGTGDKPDYNSTVALPSDINETAVFIRG